MEIEVGEYVRTKKGIRKIIKIDEDNNYYIDKTYVNDFRQEIDCITENCIIGKPSKHIIDLIEVGDYVNGDRMDIVERDENGHVYYLQNWELPSLNKNDIKSIVTKEQFTSIEYKVEEDK